MRYWKKMATILAVLLVMLSYTSKVQAEVMPRWVNTQTAQAILIISGTTASCSGRVVGLAGTTSVTGSMYLDKVESDGSLTRVRTWPALSGTSSISASGSVVVDSGATYMLTITATVTRNGVSENVSKSDVAP